MTLHEKQFIIEQRAQGVSFAQIGRQLGYPESTVRSTFIRAVKTSDTSSSFTQADNEAINPSDSGRCKYCGKVFGKSSVRKKQLFCSSKCRDDWFNEKKRRTRYKLVCEYCGQEFISYGNRKKRFCSRQCYANARKEAGNG